MRIRSLLLPAIALAAPAIAHAQTAPADRAEQVAAALQNPLVQDAAARALTQLAGIVLDTKVGPIAALAAPDAGVRANDTLRDITRRGGPDVERQLYDRTKHAIGTAGAVAGAATKQAAEIDRTADRLTAALAPLIAAMAPHGNTVPAQ
jgi:hypothetical protein